MPWSSADAKSHKKGLSAKQARQWAHVANSQLQTCLDKGGSQSECEGQAIRAANAAVEKGLAKYDADVEQDADESLYTLVLKQDTPLRYTLGIVYEPLELDSQGDFAKADTIRKAQWEFMRRLQGRRTLTKWNLTLLDAIVKALTSTTPLRIDVTDMVEDLTKARALLGDQHSSWEEGYGDVVECYCMPCDVMLNDQVVKAGSWMLGVVWSPEYFAKIQAGERTGYSMGGKGRRKFVEQMLHLMEAVDDAA